jgi:hypothetical protein
LTNIPPNLDTDSTDDFDGEWSSLLNIPAGFADNTDNDTTYSAGTGINIDGSNTISTVNLAGDVIGPITATQIAPGVITNADVSATAAILGTKIDPDFGTLDVATTGTLATGNTTITGTLSTTSTATVGGSLATPIRIENSGVVTLTQNDYTLIISGTVNDVNLPDATTVQGRIYIIKNLTGVIVSMSLDNYIPSTSTTATPDLQPGITQLQSDGTNWQQIN